MRKDPKTPQPVPTAAPSASPTASVPLAATMAAVRSKRSRVTIGVDLMGSDHSPSVLLKTLQSLSLPPHVALAAIGTAEWKKQASFLQFYPASMRIEMDENPLHAVRKKREASLCIGMQLLKTRRIDALVSLGNTGALVAAAKMMVGTFPGILRPALLALMPTKKDPVAVLDVGANVKTQAEHLIQFARLGAAYQRACSVVTPRVGLLNIGSEPIKGTSERIRAYQMLLKKEAALYSFIGNIEGKELFDGEVDVLVTDGFTGNIFLKTAEGLASFILEQLHTHIPKKLLQQLKNHLDYPGALLIGTKKLIIKCHGASSPKSFGRAVQRAAQLIEDKFMDSFKKELTVNPKLK